MESDMPRGNLTLEDAVRLPDDVVAREIDGEAVLLNLSTGIYFGLNKVGSRILTLLQRDGSLRKVAEAIEREYDVERVRLDADLLALVNQLREKGLVEEDLPTPA
jgi:coenzyme PQQ synthesis protein D (PqqD)